MMDSFDVLLVDLQDLGCRVYTFLTTLRYVLEAAAERGKAVRVLDRPNPAGRPVEGLRLREGWRVFVGAGALPIAHGSRWARRRSGSCCSLGLDVDCSIIEMPGMGTADRRRADGWPRRMSVAWVNPSPNASNPWMARCYAGP